MLKKIAIKNPMGVAFIIRGMYILDGLKNYTLIVLDNPFISYISSSALVNSVYVMKNVLIGFQLKEINDLMSHKKNWDELNIPEKFFFILVLILISFTFIATAGFSIWAKKKMEGKFYFMK